MPQAGHDLAPAQVVLNRKIAGRAWTDNARRPTDAVASSAQHRSSEMRSSGVLMPMAASVRAPPEPT
jgi:hypothetical protein